jgi:tetratricopeptide (TPR) repeat protein
MRVKSGWMTAGPLLLAAFAAMPGCGPSVSEGDLGTIVFEVPAVPGADKPYELPRAEGVGGKSPRGHGSTTKAPQGTPADLPFDLSSPLPDTWAATAEEARRLNDWLVASFPGRADTYDAVAQMHFWTGDLSAAEKHWAKCLQLNPGHPNAYSSMGVVAIKKGDHAKAVDLLRKALELSPTAPLTAIDLATELITLNRFEEAVAVLKKYVRDAFDPTPGLILLGKAYLSTNDYYEAKNSYDAAAKLRPYLADARFGLATACQRLGEADKAREQMAIFKELKAKEEAFHKTQVLGADDLGELRKHLAAAYKAASRICAGARAGREAEQFAARAARFSGNLPPVTPAAEASHSPSTDGRPTGRKGP